MMTLMLLFAGVVGGLRPGLLCSALVWNGSDSAAEPNLIIPKCQEICYNTRLYQTKPVYIIEDEKKKLRALNRYSRLADSEEMVRQSTEDI